MSWLTSFFGLTVGAAPDVVEPDDEAEALVWQVNQGYALVTSDLEGLRRLASGLPLRPPRPASAPVSRTGPRRAVTAQQRRAAERPASAARCRDAGGARTLAKQRREVRQAAKTDARAASGSRSAWALSASTRLPAPPTVRTTGDPGAYEPQASTTISAGASAKQSPSIKARQGKSAFNTTGRFASAFDGVPNTPGPGTYEPELQRRANGGAASVFTSGSARACLAPTRRRGVPSPSAGPTSWAIRPGEATTPSPSFASKRPRIPVPRAATPASIGPGRYSPELYRETEKMCR